MRYFLRLGWGCRVESLRIHYTNSKTKNLNTFIFSLNVRKITIKSVCPPPEGYTLPYFVCKSFHTLSPSISFFSVYIVFLSLPLSFTLTPTYWNSFFRLYESLVKLKEEQEKNLEGSASVIFFQKSCKQFVLVVADVVVVVGAYYVTIVVSVHGCIGWKNVLSS